MKLKTGMYIRTNEGIRQIIDVWDYGEGLNSNVYELNKHLHYNYPEGHNLYEKDIEEIVINTSDDIAELIEVGDFVNGHKVEKIWEDADCIRFAGCNYMWEITDKDIKTVLTKEQFENTSYKVEV